MTVILIFSKAEEDLESINARIASDNPQAANQLLDKIVDKFETLEKGVQPQQNPKSRESWRSEVLYWFFFGAWC